MKFRAKQPVVFVILPIGSASPAFRTSIKSSYIVLDEVIIRKAPLKSEFGQSYLLKDVRLIKYDVPLITTCVLILDQSIA